VTKDSFEKWYSSQTEYRKFDDLSKEDQSRVVKEHKDDGLGKALRESGQAFDEDKLWLSLKEASLLIGKSESTILRFIQSGELPAVQVNRSWRIRNDEIRWFLLEHEDKDEGSND
jgi:excisionase family DNA binding protein